MSATTTSPRRISAKQKQRARALIKKIHALDRQLDAERKAAR